MAGNVTQLSEFKCGYVTILGRPNVGKSTLLNQLLDQKLSIISRKPQTTRAHLLGIKNQPGCQAIYIDTPGIQSEFDSPLHRHMNAEAKNSLEGVDIILVVIEALKWSDADEVIVNMTSDYAQKKILVINKIDKCKNKTDLLPFIQQISTATGDFEIIPVSAKTGKNISTLEKRVAETLPIGPALYSEDHITNRNKKFFAAEYLREKLINRLGDEIPYRLAVTIDEFEEDNDIVKVKATIWVEGESKKNIVVGKNGINLKQAGEAARKDMEKMFDKKVYLNSWVKVKKNWTQFDSSLELFGLIDNEF